MVRDTAGHRADDAESRTVIALDLATLGDDPPRFDAWTEMVWLEYRHLFAAESDPRGAFLNRRARVLDALLQQCRGLGELPGFGERFASNLARLAAQAGRGGPCPGDQ
jgi:predicted metal-dependent HD superfamily phosphohydrolase